MNKSDVVLSVAKKSIERIREISPNDEPQQVKIMRLLMDVATQVQLEVSNDTQSN